MSVASVPTSRPRRYARPGDGLSVTSATCTRTARKKVGDMTFQERCVDAVLRSESWVFTPVTADGDPIDGCYIQTPTHFKALEKLAAGEIAEGDVPAAYQADSMTCTCLSAHAPCPHVIALRHHFQRPNQLVVAALAMAEAVARHRDGAEEADAEPAERPSTLAELRARDGSMWD